MGDYPRVVPCAVSGAFPRPRRQIRADAAGAVRTVRVVAPTGADVDRQDDCTRRGLARPVVGGPQASAPLVRGRRAIDATFRDVTRAVPRLPTDWHVWWLPSRLPQVAQHDGSRQRVDTGPGDQSSGEVDGRQAGRSPTGMAASPWRRSRRQSDHADAEAGAGRQARLVAPPLDDVRRRGRHAEENTLPRLRADFAKLPEAHILEPLVFGDDRDGVRRRKVALEIQKAAAADHFEVCDRLGAAFRNDATIEVLPRFTRLADAGMMAMDLIATALGNKSSVALKDVAAHFNAAAVCSELRSAADAWRGAGAMQPRHIEQAHRFASAITTQQPLECLRAVLEHHEIHGGGLRWFVLRDRKVEARSRPRAGSSRYRFRLWSLCRLGAQCGVLRGMPAALRGDNEAEEEDETAEGGDD